MSQEATLIVGASSNFGSNLAKSLLSDDDTVIAHYNSSQQVIDSLGFGAKNGRLIPIKADLANPEDVDLMIDSIQKMNIFVKKLVFFASPKLELLRFKTCSWQDFQNGLDIELRSQFRISQEFVPKMAAQGFGNVVFVLSSTTIGMPPRSMPQYTTLKYASLGLMRAIAAEYGPNGVAINAVSPSMAATSFLEKIPAKVAELAGEKHPLKRLVSAEDIVPVIRLLLSNECRYINGTNIPITGGMVI